MGPKWIDANLYNPILISFKIWVTVYYLTSGNKTSFAFYFGSISSVIWGSCLETVPKYCIGWFYSRINIKMDFDIFCKSIDKFTILNTVSQKSLVVVGGVGCVKRQKRIM